MSAPIKEEEEEEELARKESELDTRSNVACQNSSTPSFNTYRKSDVELVT
jgi:hypothetical protein